jgi:hypothetical protein
MSAGDTSRHPSLEELLAIDDGEDLPETLRHVEGCRSCRLRRRELEQRRNELRALPLHRPAEDQWPAIRARMIASRRRRSLAGGAAVAAVVAFALSSAALIQKRLPSAEPVEQLSELIQQSQRREEKLRLLGDPEVMDIASAEAIVELEDQIALVDECIAEMGTGWEYRQPLAELWQTRITLLDALAQARNPAFARLNR